MLHFARPWGDAAPVLSDGVTRVPNGRHLKNPLKLDVANILFDVNSTWRNLRRLCETFIFQREFEKQKWKELTYRHKKMKITDGRGSYQYWKDEVKELEGSQKHRGWTMQYRYHSYRYTSPLVLLVYEYFYLRYIRYGISIFSTAPSIPISSGEQMCARLYLTTFVRHLCRLVLSVYCLPFR